MIGALLTACIGYPISLLTGGNPNMDPKLLSPLFRRFYKSNMEKTHLELTFIATEETDKLKDKPYE